MRRPRFDMLRKLLITWVCALLLASGMPTLAFATESNPKTGASTKDASDTAYHLVAGSLQANPPSYFYPNPTTVEMLFQVQGDYADLTKEFEFQLAIPEGMSEIEAYVDDTPVTLSAENDTVALSHGQSLKLVNVPDSESYELTQTDASVAESPDAKSGCYNPQLQVITADTVKATLKHDDARVLTLSELKGTQASPAKVTITNTLQNSKVPITGIGNDDSPWLAMALASATAFAVLCALWLLRKRKAYTE